VDILVIKDVWEFLKGFQNGTVNISSLKIIVAKKKN